MGPVFLPRALLLGSLGWALFGGIPSAIIYLIYQSIPIHSELWKFGLAFSFSASLFLALAGMFYKFRATLPLTHIKNLLTGAAATFLIFSPGIVCIAYLPAAPESIRAWLSFALVIAAVLWCYITLSGYKQRIKERRFIEREFLFEADRIVIRQPLKTNLDPAPVSEKTFIGKIYHKFGPYLIMGVPLAYPIQRLLADTGGTAAVLLLLSILSLPLTIYILGRMTCGAYLWIYKIRQIERQYGKPVVYQTTK